MSADPDPDTVASFRADLDALAGPSDRVGIAVSGGPDSLALLILAAAARPGLVEAATVDHGIRRESADEAAMVAALCDRLGIRHATLHAGTPAPDSNLQAWARDQRYALLLDWARERDLDYIATAHHRDDQAETALMRLARGSGIGGLAGIRPSRPLGGKVRLVRPLLGWRRETLRQIVDRAGIAPVDDPSNADPRFDRSRIRRLLERLDWIDPDRLAAVADHAGEADDALDWAAKQAFAQRHRRDGVRLLIDPSGLPRELRRRLLLRAVATLGADEPPGPKLSRALDQLDNGEVTTLAGLLLSGGDEWRIEPAPPRRS